MSFAFDGYRGAGLLTVWKRVFQRTGAMTNPAMEVLHKTVIGFLHIL
jgi:hypothetical protein